MNILMIIPRYEYYETTAKINYHYYIPIGVGYIMAVLEKQGYNVDCLNLNHKEGKVGEVISKQLDSKKYGIVCAGHSGIGYNMVEKIIETINLHHSKPKIIIGGTLITSEPELVVNSLKPDFAVIGEGETTIIELVECIEKNKNFEKVNGIAFRKEGKFFFTKPREPIMDLDSLPFPDYESMGFSEKLDNMITGDDLYTLMDFPRTYPIVGSRGCPFKCTFCYRTLGENYRIRSSDNIIAELEFAVKKYNINSFNLLDDLFASNKVRLREFSEKLEKLNKKYNIHLKWFCSLWVSTVDEEILEILKKSGCLGVGLGFESYNLAVLKSMKKYITLEQIDNAIKACWKVKMPFLGNFIFGDIAETKETAKETLDYWKNHCKDQVKLFFIHPYPGSEIYNHCIKKGIIKDRMDFIKNKIHHTNIINMTDGMSDNEFLELKKEIFRLKAKYSNYIIPFKMKKTKTKSAYDLYAKCPFCNQVSAFKSHYITNPFYFQDHPHCRHCGKRFFLVSRLYKFTMKHYLLLDSLRKRYLSLRDRIRKRRI